MKRAKVDWPVWLQVIGAVAVIVAVGVLAGVGWAVLAAGASVLAVGVLVEMERLAVQGPRSGPRGAARRAPRKRPVSSRDRAGAQS